MFKLFSTSTSYPHFIHTKIAHFYSYSQSYAHYPHFYPGKLWLFNRHFSNIRFVYFYVFRYFIIFFVKSIDFLIVKLCRFYPIIVSLFGRSIKVLYYAFCILNSIFFQDLQTWTLIHNPILSKCSTYHRSLKSFFC